MAKKYIETQEQKQTAILAMAVLDSKKDRPKEDKERYIKSIKYTSVSDKLTKIESSLSNAIDKYDKAQDAFTKSYSKNKDDIIASQE